MNEQMWESRYSQPDRVWSPDPNRWLVEIAAELPAGTAADVGCGEGADAIWLAQHGWQVVAMDFASSALRTGAAAAAAEGVGDQIRWVRQDLTAWEPESGGFDLVSVEFLHGDPDVRRAVHRKAWAATGGTLLIVGHDTSNAEEGHGGPPDPRVLYTAAEVVKSLGLEPDDPRIVVAERRARSAGEPDRIMLDCVVVVRRG